MGSENKVNEILNKGRWVIYLLFVFMSSEHIRRK